MDDKTTHWKQQSSSPSKSDVHPVEHERWEQQKVASWLLLKFEDNVEYTVTGKRYVLHKATVEMEINATLTIRFVRKFLRWSKHQTLVNVNKLYLYAGLDE